MHQRNLSYYVKCFLSNGPYHPDDGHVSGDRSGRVCPVTVLTQITRIINIDKSISNISPVYRSQQTFPTPQYNFDNAATHTAVQGISR